MSHLVKIYLLDRLFEKENVKIVDYHKLAYLFQWRWNKVKLFSYDDFELRLDGVFSEDLIRDLFELNNSARYYKEMLKWYGFNQNDETFVYSMIKWYKRELEDKAWLFTFTTLKYLSVTKGLRGQKLRNAFCNDHFHDNINVIRDKKEFKRILKLVKNGLFK